MPLVAPVTNAETPDSSDIISPSPGRFPNSVADAFRATVRRNGIGESYVPLHIGSANGGQERTACTLHHHEVQPDPGLFSRLGLVGEQERDGWPAGSR
jgi:hypothetical protein